MRIDGNCAVKCWGMAAVAGLLVFLLVLERGFGAALVLAVLALVLLGLLFNWLFCGPLPVSRGMATPVTDSDRGAHTPAVTSPAAPALDASVSARAAGAGTSAAAGAATAGATVAAAEAETAPEEPEAVRPEPVATEAASDEAEAHVSKEDAATVGADTVSGTSAPDETASETKAPTDATTAPVLKSSTPLAGEAELADRKGSWRYSKDGPGAGAAASSAEIGDDVPTSAPTPAPTPAPTAAPAESAAVATTAGDPVPADLGPADYDGNGVMEGTGEGEEPPLLDGPRNGQADNLKEIKGIGPKLEKVCHSLGVYHFDQIAAWTDQEVAWANANMTGFRGRVTRDNWVEQAKVLAAGGETDFSKRVDKGGVYE